MGHLGRVTRCHVVRLAHSIPPCGVAETVAVAAGRPAAPTLGSVPTLPDPPAPPPELGELAPGWEPTLAYRLVPHLTTWRLTGPDGDVRFAKVAVGGDRFPTLRAESERMIWAAPYLPVPVVVALTEIGDATILLTEALPGQDATCAVWRDDLPGLVQALGRGLRRFHEAVGEEWCPFRFDLARALAHVEDRVRRDDIDPGGFHPEHAHLTPAAALRRARGARPRHRGPGRVPRRLLPAQRVAPGRAGDGLRRSGRAGRGRPLVGPRRRGLEHRLEFR